MKRYLVIVIVILISASSKAQFPGTDSLRNYNNKYITNNPATSFTNLRLNTLLRGIIDWVDTARAGSGGGGALGVDTLWAINDSTIRYKKNGVFRNFVLKGVYDTRRKVDTAYAVNDTTLRITINGQVRNIILPGRGGTNLATANQTATGDRTHDWAQHWFYINNLKSFGLNSNGADAVHTSNSKLFQFFSDSTIEGYPLRFLWGLKNVNGDFTDSIHFELTSTKGSTYLYHYGLGTARSVELDLNGNVSNPNITMYVAGNSKFSTYTFGHVASIEPNDSTRMKLVSTPTATKVVTARAEVSGVYTLGISDMPSGSGGVDEIAVIGTGAAKGATIVSDSIKLHRATPSTPGIVTTDSQSIAGDKSFLGKRSNFNGYGPRLNTQLLASAKDADSLYVSGKYLGFGFCGVFKSGVRVMVYVKADNHVGGNSIIMIGKSYDQGRTYTADTLINQLHGGVNDTLCTLGGGGIGPDNRLIIFYKRFRFSSPSFFNIDQRIAISDDEGATLTNDQAISHGSNTEYLPYSGLVTCANNELLLSWYGQNGSTWSVYVIKSSDGGLTWGSAITVFSNTASQRDESTFEHLGGGTIIGLMRGEPTDTLYGQVISYDNGTTWAYQGQVSFGIPGTPAWLSAFRSQNGKMAVACYYRVGTQIRATYSYADSVILGPSHWDVSRTDTVARNVNGSGYFNACHPYQGMEGWAFYYTERIPQTTATVMWSKLPVGGAFPIGVGTGVSGLTAGRIPVASSATSLTDYSALKYSSSNTSIVLNGAAGNTWSAHNGVPLESAHNSLLLSDNNYINIMDNAYLDTDYKYKTNGSAGILAMTSGRLHFYGGPSGSTSGVISLSELFSIRNAGDFYVNGSAGLSGQVLMSGGIGSAAAWGSIVSSQWATVTGGIAFNAAGNVGYNISAPAAPVHINGATVGSGNFTTIISDNNSSIGTSFVMEYRGASVAGTKRWGNIIDNNGNNFARYADNGTGTGTSIALFSTNNNFIVGSTTDNGARGQFNGDVTVADEAYDATAWNGSLEVPTKNAVRDKIETLSGSNIRNSSGTVTGNYVQNFNQNQLKFDSVKQVTISIDKADASSPTLRHKSYFWMDDDFNGGTPILLEASLRNAANTQDSIRNQIGGSGANVYIIASSENGTENASAFADGGVGSVVPNAGLQANNTTTGKTSIIRLYPDSLTMSVNAVQAAASADSVYASGPVYLKDGILYNMVYKVPAGSGSWSPTLIADANVDGTPTALHATYTRQGNIVTCYVTVSVDPTANTTQTEVGIPLPVASNFSTSNDASGSGSGSAGNGQATFVQVNANTASDRATLIFQSGSTSASIITLTFRYTVQ